jgi:hypothetical protein
MNTDAQAAALRLLFVRRSCAALGVTKGASVGLMHADVLHANEVIR